MLIFTAGVASASPTTGIQLKHVSEDDEKKADKENVVVAQAKLLAGINKGNFALNHVAAKPSAAASISPALLQARLHAGITSGASEWGVGGCFF